MTAESTLSKCPVMGVIAALLFLRSQNHTSSRYGMSFFVESPIHNRKCLKFFFAFIWSSVPWQLAELYRNCIVGHQKPLDHLNDRPGTWRCSSNKAETRQCGAPPKIIFRGSLAYFFLDGDAKERAPKGRCQARGVWGHAPQKILRNLTLFWRLFVRFEPSKFLSFNKG